MDARSVRRRGQIYVALAAVAWSSAGVLQRELTVDVRDPGRRAARCSPCSRCSRSSRSRNVGASAGRSPRWDGPGSPSQSAPRSPRASFIVALNHTTVANVLFMQAVAPIAAAVIAWLALREPVSRRTAVAMLVALGGVGLMVGGPGGAHGARPRALGGDDSRLRGSQS